MNFRHIRYFVAVAEAGSVARAAARLRVAQPALSKQIHDFEAHCGRPLFARHSHGLTLTLDGSTLLPRAREILAALDEAIQQARRANAGDAGHIRIGLSPYATESMRVSRGLTRVRAAFPGVSLEIKQMLSEAQAAALRSGEIDMGIAVSGMVTPESLDSNVLFADPMNCAIVPASHRFAAASEISIEDLRKFALIHYVRNTIRAYPEVIAALARIGLEAAEEHETVDAVYWQVAAGKGWSFGLASQKERPPTGTVVVPLTDFSIDTTIVARVRTTDESRVTRLLLDALVASTAEPPQPITLPATTETGGSVRGLEVRHLQALMAVCEGGSLSRGAERLGISQSGASRRLSTLEGLLDIKLLEHVGTGVIPTIAGRVLAAQAADVVHRCEVSLRASIGTTGRCRLGLVPTQTNEQALVDVMREVGGEVLEVTEMISSDVEDSIRRGRIDVGIFHAYGAIDDPGIATLPLSDDAIDCALLPANHPLANRSRITASQLADEPFLFVSRQTTPKLYDRVFDELERMGLRPAMGATVSNPRAIRGMVAASMGWTVGLRSQRQIEMPGVVGVPIVGMHISAGAQLAWRRHERDARTLDVVRAFKNWKMTRGTSLVARLMVPPPP